MPDGRCAFALAIAAAVTTLAACEKETAVRDPDDEYGLARMPAVHETVEPPEATSIPDPQLAPAPGRYGNVPESAVPFGGMREPYTAFFLEETPFLGTGREKPEPSVETVRIGFLGPIEDSPDRALGLDMFHGTQLAIEEANAEGGHRDSVPFELIVRNDAAVWGASANEVVDMVYEEGVWGLIGSIDGANTHIALRVVLKAEIAMVCTGSTDPTVTETRIPWLVRCVADDRQNSYALARFAFGVRGHRRPAALRHNSRYGRMGIAEFTDTARRMGRALVSEVRFPVGHDDDCIVLWGDGAELGAAVAHIREAGLPVPIYGPDRIVCDEFLEAAGGSAEGVVATYPSDPESTDPAMDRFRESFRERFGDDPGHFAAHAYDGTNMLLAAIEVAGLNRARIRDELVASATYHGVTGEIILDATRNDVGPVWLAEVRDGRFRSLGQADQVTARSGPRDGDE